MYSYNYWEISSTEYAISVMKNILSKKKVVQMLMLALNKKM